MSSNSQKKDIKEIVAFLEKLFVAVLYSSLFISFCGFALTVETYQLAGLPISLPMAWFVFASTLFTYNISSVQAELAKLIYGRKSNGKSWVLRNRKALSLLAIAGLLIACLLYFYSRLNLNFWFLLHLAIISIGYTVPIIYKSRKAQPLRKIPLLKVFLIAYVWAAVTIFFPLMDAGVELWDGQALLLFMRRFLFILALALLFDIRDYTYDQKSKVLTIPGLIGVRKTKLLSLGLLLVYCLLVSISEQNSPAMYALMAGAIVAAVVVLFSTEYNKRVYYLLLADGAMLMHAALVYIAAIKGW